MIELPPLDDAQKLKLTELHRLAVATHEAVIRLESKHTVNAESLKAIEQNTGNLATFARQFLEQLDTTTKIASGKNQIPISLVIVALVLVTAYAISNNIKDSKQNIRIPWAGIYIDHDKTGGEEGGK